MKRIDKLFHRGKEKEIEAEKEEWEKDKILEAEDELNLYRGIEYIVKFWFRELNNWVIEPVVQINWNVYWFEMEHTILRCGEDIPDKTIFSRELSKWDKKYYKPIHEFIFYDLYNHEELRGRLTRWEKFINHPHNVIDNTRHHYYKDNYHSYFEYDTIEKWLEDLNYLWNWFVNFKREQLKFRISDLEMKKEWRKTKRILF